VWVLNVLSNVGVRAFGVEPRDELASAHTAEELAVLVATSREEGTIQGFAAELLSGVLDFSGREVASVMVPRDRICSVTATATPADAEAVVLAQGHSRLPVTGTGGIDDVLGFVHAKDLLQMPAAVLDRPLPPRLLRRMLVVPRERSLEDLLLAMRRSRVHFALVTEPDGTTAGIVTLDDLLEELVGDITDEPGHR
jgi:CBS domain containing-hemolysin-like protein